MSLLKVELEHKEKPVSNHPWEKTVRSIYANEIRHVHNSLNNPIYPNKPNKSHPARRANIQIIGDRFSKEFIYCVKIVSGLHKYRWRKFEAPIIKGVTTAKWPEIQHQMRLLYPGKSYCITDPVMVIYNGKFLGGVKELQELVESKYIYYLCYDNKKESIDAFAKFVKSSGRPYVYMHISIDNAHVGTLIFMLYADILPQTCENFLRRCKDRKGGYSGTPVHRIVKDSWLQCGGYTLKENDLSCENFIVPHDQRGVLAMTNDGRDINCSTQFFILLQPQPWMACKYVAFGQLIDGEATLKAIEEVPTWYESPKSEIIIYQSGILNLECQDIMINPSAHYHIQKHIENLFILGEILHKELIARLYEAMEFRYCVVPNEIWTPVSAKIYSMEIAAMQEKGNNKDAYDEVFRLQDDINDDFDVEDYEFEYETSPTSTSVKSSVPIPEKTFYLALTDVPYEDEKNSEYDVKKFLRGDYCLESDLVPSDKHEMKSLLSIFREACFSARSGAEMAEVSRVTSLNYEEEAELKEYLMRNVERVSFAGAVIREIRRGYSMMNLFENVPHFSTDMVSFCDEEVRRLKLIDAQTRGKPDRKVTLSSELEPRGKIRRRQTTFVQEEDSASLRQLRDLAETSASQPEKEDEDTAKVDDARHARVILDVSHESTDHKVVRRPTGFVRNFDMAQIIDEIEDEENQEENRKNTINEDDLERKISSARTSAEGTIKILKTVDGEKPIEVSKVFGFEDEIQPKLFNAPHITSQAPTLKTYKPQKHLHFTDLFKRGSGDGGALHDDSRPETGEYQYLRHSLTIDNLPDYGNQAKSEQKDGNISEDRDGVLKINIASLRSYEYSKVRPTLSVSEYKRRNLQFSRKQKENTKGKDGLGLPEAELIDVSDKSTQSSIIIAPVLSEQIVLK